MVDIKIEENIIDRRIQQVKNELVEILGEYMETDYDYSGDYGTSVYVNRVEELMMYIDWMIENNTYDWRRMSDSNKKGIIKLLSDYLVLCR